MLGAKPVNLERAAMWNVNGVQDWFFACASTCAGQLHSPRLPQPRMKRVVERVWMALALLLGTQLRAGDDAEIMADDLPPRRKVYTGLVTVAALTYGADIGTTLLVQYVHMSVVTVDPADICKRGGQARRCSLARGERE